MIGATVPKVGGVQNAFKWGDKWGLDVVQFYLTLSRQWKVNELTEKDRKEFLKNWKESQVKEVVAHIPYLVNLTSKNKKIREKSISRLAAEVERAKWLKVKYLVLHPGSPGGQGKTEGIKLLKEGFKEVFKRVEPGEVEILIETMAGQGTSLGSTFEEVAEILSVLSKPETFGVCFDSAHVFEAGYGIDSKEGYKKTFEKFTSHISPKKIKVFHLNDSKTKKGSEKDRHTHIGKGELGMSFFKFLSKDKRFKETIKILETPDPKSKNDINLRKIRELGIK